MTKPTVTAIVLAGGRATRFGGSKLEATLEGESLLGRATRVVAKVASEVIVAGPALPVAMSLPDVPSPLATSGISLRLVIDAAPFQGPLVALEGALREARGTLAIVVAGDMPWLQAPVLELLLARLDADAAVDAVTLAEPSRRQVLPLAIRVGSARTAAATAIAEADRSLVRLLDRLRSIEIPANEWLALDPEARTLRDVDRMEDLAKIRREFR
jgi:molybdopterin-guanine dinucleotide biosynthesis protein A